MRRPSVLLVDDDASTRRLVGEILRPFNVDVQYAEDGTVALASVQAATPDLVILDIALPGLDGWQVLAAFRQGRAAPTVPVIVITAHGYGVAAERALNGGAHLFFEKPFIPSQLAEAIQLLLETESEPTG